MLFWSNASWSWATQVVKVKHDNRERYIHYTTKSSWCIYANQHFEMRSWELHWVSSVLFSPKLAMLHQLNCKQQSVLILRSRDSFYYILKHSISFFDFIIWTPKNVSEISSRTKTTYNYFIIFKQTEKIRFVFLILFAKFLYSYFAVLPDYINVSFDSYSFYGYGKEAEQ